MTKTTVFIFLALAASGLAEGTSPGGAKPDALTTAVLAVKPYSLELRYDTVVTALPQGELRPNSGIITTITTPEFLAHANTLSTAVAPTDVGSLAVGKASVVYKITRFHNGFLVQFSVHVSEGGTQAFNGSAVLMENEWTIVAGSQTEATGVAKRYFYAVLRLQKRV